MSILSTTMAISSRIKDFNYFVGRVRAAEYYIDSDPGQGKGTAMTAVDGMFDAVNGAPENINGIIDTSNLTVGTHTVYVRGMDIGKQWSLLPATATLNVTESTGFINGTVRNTTGAAITGVRVRTNTGIYSDTANTGFYSLKLSNGTYVMTASRDPDYYMNTSIPSVTVTAFTTIERNITMTRKPTGNITGRIKY